MFCCFLLHLKLAEDKYWLRLYRPRFTGRPKSGSVAYLCKFSASSYGQRRLKVHGDHKMIGRQDCQIVSQITEINEQFIIDL